MHLVTMNYLSVEQIALKNLYTITVTSRDLVKSIFVFSHTNYIYTIHLTNYTIHT